MTTGAAATSICVRKYTAVATQNNITPTKNTRRPSRSRSRRAHATLDDLREAIKTLEDVEPTARRTLGGTHSYVAGIKGDLDASRARLRAREAAGST